MPYHWTQSPEGERLTLWPHNSLTARGFVAFIGITTGLLAVPLLGTLGSPVLWALLPFLLAAVASIWVALRRNNADRRVREVLRLTEDSAQLTREEPGKPTLDWQANRYWVKPVLHPNSGPVPHYLTLRGGPREVELGAFLSEDERKTLYTELAARLSKP